VKDPAKAAILADIDHGFATKRPPIDTGYFETYNRDNVALVNLRAEPIERITATGVKTSKGEYPLDIIVFATGFDAMTGPLFNLNIAGRNGLALRDVWREGPRSYLGLQVVGFPNLFTVTGPGSPSVLTNMPVAIEQHVDWISRCIADMRAAGQTRIEAKPDAVDDWMVQVQEVASRTLFPKTPHSWYLGANVPGKPRVFMPYIGGMAKYRRICDEVADKGYEGFALGA
jgi:cation diffusion facilitator CzcD-associated flavoprotein CzcO